MKTKLFGMFVLGVAATSVFTAGANAVMIGVDFNLGGSANQSPASTDVVGPYASAGWYNQFDLTGAPSPISLVNSANGATGATFGFTQGGNAKNGNPTYNSGYGAAGTANVTLTPNQQLFNGAANASGGGYDQEVNITNIPYTSFDVYVLVKAPVGNQGYGDAGYYDEASLQIFNGATAGTTYFLGSSQQNPIPASSFSYTQATSTNVASPTMEANYVLFSGLTGGSLSSFSFDLHAPANNGDPYFFGSYGNGYISGLQIVDTSAVPEPTTLGLIGLLLTPMLGRRRMRSVK